MSEVTTPPQTTPPKKENLWINLLLNVVVPTLILTKLSKEEYLGPTLALIIALAFPIGYGIWDYFTRRKWNFLSGLGMAGVLLTGGISLLELDPKYIAIKEAAVPGILALATLISNYTRYPLVKTIMLNDSVLKMEAINQALQEQNTRADFDRVLTIASYLVASSFLLSSVLNYVLAKMIVVSAPGSVEYTQELGKMTALSYPVIVLPGMLILMGSMFYLFRNITRLTKLSLDEILIQQ
ncbi:VC0807 family protein [Halioxenophilus sp. WMMB6]|uniref:VC0807 family protein n=1 Tax=Halioxenophilus sp. WMMB6 TaxID=3073815 RepID=UPI00295F24FC|nr:VC0807 family protein [Halioxenophilus sp. WMMB6]